MKKIKLISVVAALCLACAGAYAQDRTEYDSFSAAAKEQLMLFRGRQATSYNDVLYNGHYFWSTPEFRTGDVSYNGRVYHDILLNIDAVEGKLIARYSMEMPAVAVDGDYVPWFTIGPERYVNLRLAGVDASPGFYEQLSDGSTPVYLRVHKTYVRSTGNANGALIGYEDPYYDSSILAYFRIDSSYYCLTEGRLKKVSRRKALKIIAHGE